MVLYRFFFIGTTNYIINKCYKARTKAKKKLVSIICANVSFVEPYFIVVSGMDVTQAMQRRTLEPRKVKQGPPLSTKQGTQSIENPVAKVASVTRDTVSSANAYCHICDNPY